jgi:hypothetical protein
MRQLTNCTGDLSFTPGFSQGTRARDYPGTVFNGFWARRCLSDSVVFARVRVGLEFVYATLHVIVCGASGGLPSDEIGCGDIGTA